VKTAFADLTRVLAELKSYGILLKSDPKLPSVTTLVAGEAVKGSWWGHPRSHDIFRILEELADHPEVTVAKLVSGKDTFVHKRLWPSLIAIGSSRELWQLQDLSAAAQDLFDMLITSGDLRTDQIAGSGGVGPKAAGDAARELEQRLLVHANQVHTETGAHAKALETWGRWARRIGFLYEGEMVDTAEKKLEKLVLDLNTRFNAKGKLPWLR
jgi:hypothetical protein